MNQTHVNVPLVIQEVGVKHVSLETYFLFVYFIFYINCMQSSLRSPIESVKCGRGCEFVMQNTVDDDTQ